MKSRLGLWIGVFALAALAHAAPAAPEFGDEFFYMKSTEPDQIKLNTLVGKRLPELTVGPTKWVNGALKASDLKGKVVLVDVWATWCGPCLAAIPHNNELVAKHSASGLVVVGVCTSSRGQEKLESVAKERNVSYLTCNDPESKLANSMNVAFYPTYIAVDRKGIVRAAGLRPDKTEEVVLKLLKEPAAEKKRAP
jgi:thiol-disulfide isomerase/thioredoxin